MSTRVTRSWRRGADAAVLVAGLAVSAAGQSLFETAPMPVIVQPAPGPGAPGGGGVGAAPAEAGPDAVPGAVLGAPTLASVSLQSVAAPEPRTIKANDLVTIIVSERSQLDRSQTVELEKDYDNTLTVANFLDLLSLLELQSAQTSAAKLPRVGVSSSTSFEGDGTYEREDRLTDRVTARVLEVKPNGTLLLEARRSVITDEEESVITLSGYCRSEDVTDRNTVQSNQLFDMALNVQNSGELKRSNRKGVIPRALELLFSF